MNVASPATITLLYPRAPYRFDYALNYFSRRVGEFVDRVHDGGYRRLFVLPYGAVLAEIRPGHQDALQLTVTPASGTWSGEAADDATRFVAATLSRTLGLDDDLTPFRAVVATDPVLSAIVDRFAGLRLVSTPTAFEAFVWAVLGQQISLHVAFRLKSALVQHRGIRAGIDGETYWAFPTPAALAEANPDELAALGLGRRKAATIVSTAAAIAAGSIDLQGLGGMPLDDAEAALTALHGVGPWTAHYMLLRGLRRSDACPVSDIGLRSACGRLFDLGRHASAEEVAAYAERWRPFRGYAAFYLWYMLTDSSLTDSSRKVSDG